MSGGMTRFDGGMTNMRGGIAGRSESTTPMGAIGEQFVLAYQIASTLMHATLIPDHLRGERKKVNGNWTLVPYAPEQVQANVLMVVNRALQWNVDPIALIAESFVVGGKLDFQGKVIIAVVNRLGGLRSNLKFDYNGTGNELTVVVSGTLKTESEPRTISLCYKDAVTKDKDGNVNEQWRKDVESKLAYSGAKKWARRHTPEVVLGLFSEDEEEPVPTVDGSVLPASVDNRAETVAKLESQLQGMTVYGSYSSRIVRANSRDELSRIVDRIKAEPSDVLDQNGKQDLIGSCKARWTQLGAQEQQEQPRAKDSFADESQIPAGSDETIDPALDDRILHYEAMISESQSPDELEKWIQTIDKDDLLPIATVKQLGKYANERMKNGFQSVH